MGELMTSIYRTSLKLFITLSSAILVFASFQNCGSGFQQSASRSAAESDTDVLMAQIKLQGTDWKNLTDDQVITKISEQLQGAIDILSGDPAMSAVVDRLNRYIIRLKTDLQFAREVVARIRAGTTTATPTPFVGATPTPAVAATPTPAVAATPTPAVTATPPPGVRPPTCRFVGNNLLAQCQEKPNFPRIAGTVPYSDMLFRHSGNYDTVWRSGPNPFSSGNYSGEFFLVAGLDAQKCLKLCETFRPDLGPVRSCSFNHVGTAAGDCAINTSNKCAGADTHFFQPLPAGANVLTTAIKCD